MTSKKPTTQLSLYRDYMGHIGDRLEVFAAIADRFGAKSGIYPGSYVHVTPSLVIPTMIYVDMDRRTKEFFADASVRSFVRRKRRYQEEPQLTYYQHDYREPLPEPDASHDLLISMWAGFVSQHCKRYLKRGGFLVANNSDPDYELVAAFNRSNKLVEDGLDQYFVPKKAQVITAEQLRILGRGIAYTRPALYYLFR
jgi:hypothetical protein